MDYRGEAQRHKGTETQRDKGKGEWKKKLMEIIFGPLSTRRLGMSLGIDLVPAKTCNMNCIYCECGATTHLTNDMIPDITPAMIAEELHSKIGRIADADYITLTASGEPTLNPFLDDIIAMLNKMTAKPLALITNASLLYKKEIREKIRTIDVVLPSLDAATRKTFKTINKPHNELKIENIIDGIKALCESDTNSQNDNPAVWLEIMLAKNINDNSKDIEKLKEAVHFIKPQKLQLNTPVRPGTSPKAIALSREELIIIGNQFDYPYELLSCSCSISCLPPAASSYKAQQVTPDSILFVIDILERRPMTFDHLKHSSGLDFHRLSSIIHYLLASDKIQKILQNNEVYYFINHS